ncbi:P1 protein [Grapevine enamovirus 1]|uniref:P1 protein n=1 Tax=Grapevine enamovirus 1 TaxID=2560515 RepID=A0A1B3B5B2_9VIRU|nr:P1 protein [Grapevine enamovirus 1]AOE46789.1 P1 protein [Grapevine enamovirus 1]
MSPNQILIMIVALPLFFISLASSCSHIRQVGAAPLEGTLPMTPRSSAVFHLFADSEPKTMTSWEDLEPDLELSTPNPSLYTLLKDAVQESRTQGCATFEMRVNDYSLTLDGTYICIARAMGVTVFKWLLACRTTQYLMSFPGLIQEILLTSCGALLGLLLWLIDGLHICFEVALTTYFWFVGYLIYAAVMYKPTTTMTLMGMVWLHCWATSQPIVRFLVRRLMWPILTTLTSIHWALLTPMRMMISILTRLVLKSPQKSNPTTGVDSSPELCHGENCSCKTWEVVGERKESVMQGVHSLCLPAEPPKGCIAHFDYEDGSHCGFGVCVKLQSGKVAIAVPCHVLKNATSVWGPKGAIDVKDFTPLYLDGKGDMALITGAANWQSLCGFKPRRMLPITQVHTGPHNMFFQNGKGSWFNQPAMILGRNGVALRVKYNSDYGFSGLPIFDDRSRVVALHVGADEVLPGAYENKAGFLLDFPGVTTSTMSYKPESAYKDSALARYVDDFDYEVTDKPIKVKVGKIWYGIVLSGADQKKPDVWADADDEDLDEYLDYIGSKMHTESAPFSRSLNCAPLHRQGNQTVVAEPVKEALKDPKAVEPRPAMISTPHKEEVKADRDVQQTPVVEKKQKLSRRQAKLASMAVEEREAYKKAERARSKAKRGKKLSKEAKAELEEHPFDISKPKTPAPPPKSTPIAQATESAGSSKDSPIWLNGSESGINWRRIEDEVIKNLSQKPIAGPQSKRSSRGSTTWKRNQSTKKVNPQKVSNGQEDVRPTFGLPKGQTGVSGEPGSLRPQSGLDVKSKATVGQVSEQRQS